MTVYTGSSSTGVGVCVWVCINAFVDYSETCLSRLLKRPSKCGLCNQVVSLYTAIRLEIASLGPGCSGLLGQVVTISEWSP